MDAFSSVCVTFKEKTYFETNLDILRHSYIGYLKFRIYTQSW